ncbi:phosphoethanolamine transferase [Thalassotalea montiporae]
MELKVNNKFLIVPVTITIYCLVLNLDKLEQPLLQGIAHILLQVILLISVVSLSKLKSIRFLIAFFLGIELFTQLSYGSSLSLSLVMSLLGTSVSESFAFVKFNTITTFIFLIFLLALTFSPIPERTLTIKLMAIVGVGYLMFPALFSVNMLINSSKYDYYVQTGLARGYSKTFTTMEYITQEDLAHRLPALKSIKGVTDSVNFLSQQLKTASTWENVSQRDANNSLLVLGIGESLRAGNLGIYGYDRETTPLLSGKIDDITLFTNAYAAGTNTWNAVPTALTKSVNKPELSKSIVNLAKDAGYTTYWISNHAKTSHWDFSVSALAEQADYRFFFSPNVGGSVYDYALVDKLKGIMLERSGKTLVILHFYGSHMSFNARYPKAFDVFRDRDRLLNQYDNSVLYTDYVQSQLIDLISENEGKYLYFSDHGLGAFDGDIPLKHDVRENPELDSLQVPFFMFPKFELFSSKESQSPVSLYYFECIFAKWAQIESTDLTKDNYCANAFNNSEIHVVDSHLNIRKFPL